jgi:hypothetical protein
VSPIFDPNRSAKRSTAITRRLTVNPPLGLPDEIAEKFPFQDGTIVYNLNK